jgi:hypothetical protein
MLRKFVKDERGNAESAMVLLPVIFLFLCSMQLITAIFYRNVELRDVQSQASTRAISGEIATGDAFISIPSPDRFQDLKLLIISKRREIPTLVPGLGKLLGHALESDVTGIAVVEQQP